MRSRIQTDETLDATLAKGAATGAPNDAERTRATLDVRTRTVLDRDRARWRLGEIVAGVGAG
jgi:hypothetical protein